MLTDSDQERPLLPNMDVQLNLDRLNTRPKGQQFAYSRAFIGGGDGEESWWVMGDLWQKQRKMPT